MKWTLWPRSDSSRPNSEPTIPLPPYVGKTVMPMFIVVVGGWWLVVGGWWLAAGAGHFLTNHQQPTTNHHLRIHIHRSRQQRDGVADVQRLADEEGFAPRSEEHTSELQSLRHL